jgi:hypothetical protein
MGESLPAIPIAVCVIREYCRVFPIIVYAAERTRWRSCGLSPGDNERCDDFGCCRV